MPTGITTAHKWLNLDDTVVGVYNAWDCVADARIYRRLRQEMQAQGQWEFYCQEIRPAMAAVIEMQRRGIPYSSVQKGIVRRRLRRELKEIDEALRGHHWETHPKDDLVVLCAFQLLRWLFPTEAKLRRRRAPFTKAEWEKLNRRLGGFKPNSDAQVSRWLFDDLGLRPSGKTESGSRYSVDRDNLIRVLQKFRKKDEPYRSIVEDLLHRSRLQKLDEYLDFQPSEDGRLHPTVKMYGAHTFRFSYSNPPMHSWADELRGIIEAPDGMMLLAADYKALESRVSAALTGDEIDLAIFAEGKDIHRLTAEECFEMEEGAWEGLSDSNRKAHRNWAKTFRYGVLQYGGEPETVKTKTSCPCHRCSDNLPPTLDLGRQQLREVADRWFQSHPAALRWREKMVTQVRHHHCYDSPFGFRSYFAKPWGDKDLLRQVYNRPIQQTAKVIQLRALRQLHEEFGAPIIFEHHDSLMLLIEEGGEQRWAPIVREVMERPVAELDGAQFPVDVAVGRSWGSLKELTEA